jgi:Na+-transporting methylmalonyl-CoA/oxaloacetate decarboxylase gamma subunit
MISPKIKAGCGVLTVFGLGFGLGFLCLLFLLVRVIPLSEGWKSDRSKAFVADHLANQLKLTDEQRLQFRPLVDEALEHRWNLRRDYLLEDQRLLEEEYFPKLGELLTEPQKAKAGKMLEKWRKNQRFKIAPPDAADGKLD